MFLTALRTCRHCRTPQPRSAYPISDASYAYSANSYIDCTTCRTAKKAATAALKAQSKRLHHPTTPQPKPQHLTSLPYTVLHTYETPEGTHYLISFHPLAIADLYGWRACSLPDLLAYLDQILSTANRLVVEKGSRQSGPQHEHQHGSYTSAYTLL